MFPIYLNYTKIDLKSLKRKLLEFLNMYIINDFKDRCINDEKEYKLRKMR